MDFKRDEIETVFSYWNDYSQDINFISFETGLDKEKVQSIVDYLIKTGKIDEIPVNESKVLYFKELIKLLGD